MNQSNRAMQFALLALGLCILVAAAIGLQRSKSGQLQELNATLASKQNELVEARLKVKQLPKMEQQYKDLSQQVAILEKVLPTEAYIPTFLNQLQTLAGQTENDVLLIKPEAKRKLRASAANDSEAPASEGGAAATSSAPAAKPTAALYDEMGIQLDLEGTYWSALNFLEKLQAFPKMIAVNEVTMKPKSGSKSQSGADDDLKLDISLRLTAVMAKEK